MRLGGRGEIILGEVGVIMEKDTNKDSSATPKNIFELIQMAVDNPQLTIVTEDEMIKISAVDCSPDQALDSDGKKLPQAS